MPHERSHSQSIMLAAPLRGLSIPQPRLHPSLNRHRPRNLTFGTDLVGWLPSNALPVFSAKDNSKPLPQSPTLCLRGSSCSLGCAGLEAIAEFTVRVESVSNPCFPFKQVRGPQNLVNGNAYRATDFNDLNRPVPVVLRLFAFSLHSYFRILAAGY